MTTPYALSPTADGTTITVGTVTSNVQVSGTAGATAYVVTNIGEITAFVAVGASTVTADRNSVPVPPKTTQYFALALGGYVAGITLQGDTALVINPTS